MTYKDKEKELGLRFGRLVVIDVSLKANGRSAYLCKCDCGSEKVVMRQSLFGGITKSCGCLHSEAMKTVIKNNKTHGMSKSPIYGKWLFMIAKCTKPSNREYKYYGGRGITICDEWKNSFESFNSWADANGYKEGLTIDRIDNSKGYFPENCRFTDMKTQSRNRRSNVLITYKGETKILIEWCEELNLDYKVVHSRLQAGWSSDDALQLSVNHTWKKNKAIKAENAKGDN